MDRGLRAGKSSIANSIATMSSHLYQIKSWATEEKQYRPREKLAERYYQAGYQDRLLTEEWTVTLLGDTPETPNKTQIQSVYYSTAKEIEDNPQYKDITYDFKDVQTWKDTALQALVHAG